MPVSSQWIPLESPGHVTKHEGKTGRSERRGKEASKERRGKRNGGRA